MERLKKLEPLVEKALREIPETRFDYFILYAEVCKNFIPMDFAFGVVMYGHRSLGIPSYQSVARIRRLLQTKYPELRSEVNKEERIQGESDYREYSRTKDEIDTD